MDDVYAQRQGRRIGLIQLDIEGAELSRCKARAASAGA